VVGLQPVGGGKPLIWIWCRSVSRSALATIQHFFPAAAPFTCG